MTRFKFQMLSWLLNATVRMSNRMFDMRLQFLLIVTGLWKEPQWFPYILNFIAPVVKISRGISFENSKYELLNIIKDAIGGQNLGRNRSFLPLIQSDSTERVKKKLEFHIHCKDTMCSVKEIGLGDVKIFSSLHDEILQ